MKSARHRKNQPQKVLRPPGAAPISNGPLPAAKPVKPPLAPSSQPAFTHRNSWLEPLVLGILVYGLSLWQVYPPLQNHVQAPVFQLASRFLRDFTTYPGGLVQGLAAFLLQFYLQPWLGALISTLLMSMICAANEGILARFSLRSPWRTSCLSVPLFLLMQLDYDFPWMELGLGIAAVLGGVNVYLVWFSKPALWRGLGFLCLAAPLYYFSGGVFLLYGLLCGLCEMVRPQPWLGRWSMGLGIWSASGWLPLLASRWGFVTSTSDAYWLWLPTRHWPHRCGFAVALVLCFPLLLLANTALKRLIVQHNLAGEKRVKQSGRRWRATWLAGPAKPLVTLGTWMVLILVPVIGLQDRQKKLRSALDYWAHQQQWERVLQLGPQIRNPDPAIVFDLNQALGHTGRLLQDMFSFPQRAGWDFWFYVHDTFDVRRTMKASDALFELGQINQAERMASEDLEINGDHPAVLQRLALINILKGKPKAASVYLNVLTQTMTHRAWARKYLRQIDSDPTLSQDPELERIRSLMLRKDYDGEYDTEALMYQLLAQNQKNRLAFDYLLAHYLLTRQIDKVAEHVAGLNEFNDPVIPRHCEEAILMCEIRNKNQPVNLYGRTIRPQTREDFHRFNQVLKTHGGDLQRALPDMKRDFGNTFWFYRLYSCSATMLPYVKFESNP
jgi:hypothetical protein